VVARSRGNVSRLRLSTKLQFRGVLLQAKITHGPGIFQQTRYIQHVNAVGGLAPSTLGTSMGQLALVQNSAEYFYRAR